jgi:hypothetical protein
MDKSTKELLAQAEKLCAQRNVRLTPQRLEVLRLMSLQQGAISADLLDLLRESEPQANPTVYRALDFLLEQEVRAQGGIHQQLCAMPSVRSPPPHRRCLSVTAAAW